MGDYMEVTANEYYDVQGDNVMTVDYGVDQIREKVKEIVAELKFNNMSSSKAIISLMILYRTEFSEEYNRGFADGLTKAREVLKD